MILEDILTFVLQWS